MRKNLLIAATALCAMASYVGDTFGMQEGEQAVIPEGTRFARGATGTYHVNGVVKALISVTFDGETEINLFNEFGVQSNEVNRTAYMSFHNPSHGKFTFTGDFYVTMVDNNDVQILDTNGNPYIIFYEIRVSPNENIEASFTVDNDHRELNQVFDFETGQRSKAVFALKDKEGDYTIGKYKGTMKIEVVAAG